MSPDLLAIGLWLVFLTGGALWLSGRGRSGQDLLSAHHDLPAWAICLSVVATETSTLTVISVPGIAWQKGMVFVGLGGGYLLGRIAVARWLLPLYMRGSLTSAYEYLALRFGRHMQRTASCTFLITRLLAEGVRLFASTLPVCALLAAHDLILSPLAVLIGLTALTALYTALGGLRAVIWSDAAQFILYFSGAAVCAVWLFHGLPPSGRSLAAEPGQFFPFSLHGSVLTDAFAPLTALVGGAIMAMASHGTDQLMVQRVLAARSLKDARKAMVFSAVVVTALFALLSLCGIFLRAGAGGVSLSAAGYHSPDDVFAHFMVTGLPQGLSGLMVAGVISATMGSLSSALNAMTSSTFADLLPARPSGPGRFSTAFVTGCWAVALIAAACGFSASGQSVLIFGMQIAGYSYGALLGAFLLGMMVRSVDQRTALSAFLVTLPVMALIIGFCRPGGQSIAFPWLVPLGVIITFGSTAVLMTFRALKKGNIGQ
ncbi:sodium:solute symporter [Acetobacter sp. AN02]|uniref:sodium:solute symporter n=1 Tax=Acetobacter sp. AN02 TaxID=2894186 RepID=UPI002434182D|nr:sodium:solute symporter [Acetobacter sp. AN02]MDG6094805.1 sodium:solute symporter [Acetobacter sp. AN02]